jgi:hypothetical protein
MIMAAHQPNFLPWLGFFDKARRADRFVLLDAVQLPRRTYTTRVDIALRGRKHRLSIPVQHIGSQSIPIREARLDVLSRDWLKLARTVEAAYGNWPGFGAAGSQICQVLAAPPPFLLDLNLALLELLGQPLGLDVGRWVLESAVPHAASKTERMIALAEHLGCDTYLSGGWSPDAEAPPLQTSTGASYNDPARFSEAGIRLCYQNYREPPYETPAGPRLGGLSALDAVSALGYCSSGSLQKLLQSG